MPRSAVTPGDAAPRPGASTHRVLLGLAALTIVLAGIWALRDVFAPALLGIVVVVIVQPLHRVLTARGVPRWVATSTVVAVSWLILLGITSLVVIALGQFGRLLVESLPDLETMRSGVADFVGSLGFDPGAVRESIDPVAILRFVGSLAADVVSLVTAFAFVLVYALFASVDAARFGASITHMLEQNRLVSELRAWTRSVGRFYIINTIFGLLVALLDGIVVLVFGVPGVVVWVILAFVTNYIPSVGFIIGLVPPVILALLDSGPVTALLVLVSYCAINVALQTFIQPRFVSASLQLNTTLTFLSVIFWAVILGPVGALLAIPATLFLRAVLIDSAPGAHLGRWLSGEPPGAA